MFGQRRPIPPALRSVVLTTIGAQMLAWRNQQTCTQ